VRLLRFARRTNASAPSRLTSYEARIETSSEGRVSRAFDDGSAVGEQCHLIGVAPEFEDKVVVADDSVWLQAAIHLGEIDGALALMNLHGIPAAEGDVRTAFAREMNQIAFAAGATAGARL